MNDSLHYDAAEIIAQDKAHFLHPWTIFDSFQKEGSLPIARAKGPYIYDLDGNQYLDAVGGLWCTNIGNGVDEMADAIAAQVRELAYCSSFTDITNIPATKLAVKLAELAPGDLNHVFLSTGGSTAVDSAFRLIQYYQNCRGKHEKKHIISRQASYHGSTYASMSIGGKKADHPPEFDYITDTIHHVSSPNVYRPPAHMRGLPEQEFVNALVKEFEDKIEELGGAEKVAAFFAEPVMGAGGVIVPPGDYLQRMRQVCKKYDILYVSDEVVTGFGRLGQWFTSKELFGIQPDIITSAKGLTSGYQALGATIYSDKIHSIISAVEHGRCFTHGFTYSGHPVACAAALKNIEIMERDKILEHVRKIGPYFEQQLDTLSDLAIVGDVRGSHMMMCVEFVQDKDTGQTFPDEIDIGKMIANQAEQAGLIVRPIINLNIMSPPLILTEADIDFIVSTLRESILATIDKLIQEGYSF